MRLCRGIVDELDSQSVSEEHLVGMASKERIILLHSTRNAAPVAANTENRSQLLGIVLEAGRDMALVPGRLCTVTQMLDLARPWATCDDIEVQVIAAAAVLHVWTKMYGTYLERVGLQGSTGLADRAAFFLERATNDNEEVLEEDVLCEEHRLLLLVGLTRALLQLKNGPGPSRAN